MTDDPGAPWSSRRGPGPGRAGGAREGRLGDPVLLLELFVVVNYAFLVADAWLAHAFNAFARDVEWVPVVFSAVAALVLGANLALARRRSGEGRAFLRGGGRVAGFLVGGASIVVGVAGLVFHLESHFFRELTLRSLVYSAPFAAPLAFAGLGFLVLLNRMVPPEGREWAAWILLLACGGFLGNFALSLADHAQNGFFHATEWIPVAVAALATSHLLVLLLRTPGQGFLRVCWGILGLSALTGALGFWFHLQPVLEEAGRPLAQRVVYGAPIFAPLLFPNLSLLAALGVWDLQAKLPPG